MFENDVEIMRKFDRVRRVRIVKEIETRIDKAESVDVINALRAELLFIRNYPTEMPLPYEWN